MGNLNILISNLLSKPSHFLLSIYSQMSAIIEDVRKGKQEEKISVFPALLGNEIEHHTGYSIPKKT